MSLRIGIETGRSTESLGSMTDVFALGIIGVIGLPIVAAEFALSLWAPS